MKKFFVKLVCFLGIIVIIAVMCSAFVFNVISPQYRLNYNSALNEKIERLNSIEESKIILVGNSNVAFGFDSEKIQNEIGMPVVNLGLHGGLGNCFHEQMAKENIQPGDIVILCHTDYTESYITEPDIVWQMLEERLDLFRLISVKDYFSVFRALPQYLEGAVFCWIEGSGNLDSGDCYSRNAFNQFGDNVYPRPDLEYEFAKNSVKVPEIDEDNVKRINELNSYCESKDAKLVIAGYPIASGEYTPAAEKYEQFQSELEARMKCEIISDFTDYFIEYKYFYNTALHLNEDGVEIRTEQLIKDLKEWI